VHIKGRGTLERRVNRRRPSLHGGSHRTLLAGAVGGAESLLEIRASRELRPGPLARRKARILAPGDGESKVQVDKTSITKAMPSLANVASLTTRGKSRHRSSLATIAHHIHELHPCGTVVSVTRAPRRATAFLRLQSSMLGAGMGSCGTIRCKTKARSGPAATIARL
jgi:hypothetical protein